ncbi:glycosyltransferase family 2 protein [Actinotalea sp. AC32]|nr:glycosyltransferase family 2 protein [Actinotalea sp. AC32]
MDTDRRTPRAGAGDLDPLTATSPDGHDEHELDVSVVLVTYNAGEYVRECLETLLADGGPRVRHEVIALDNASDPPLAPLLREYLDEDHVVTLPENVGFGRACNEGVRRARGRHVLLLNPDAEVRPGTVEALVRAADAEPRAGIVGGRLVTRDGGTDPQSCWGAPTLWSTVCFATGLSTVFARSRLFDPESLGRWQRDSVRDVDIVTGCLFLMPRALWDEVGGFDPDYFMYGEDADLSRRVRDRGRRVWITPDAVALHEGGASSSSSARKAVMLMQGKVTYVRKHAAPPLAWALRTLLLTGVGLRAGLARVLRRETGWSHAWRLRSQWRDGYPPAPVAAGVTTR